MPLSEFKSPFRCFSKRVIATAAFLAVLFVQSVFHADVSATDCIGCPAPTFAPAHTYVAPDTLGELASGDFNNDGKVDLAIRSPSNIVSLLLGDGLGGFGAPISLPDNSGGDYAFQIVTADLNNDGNLDLILGGGGGFDVLYGDGTGHFGPAYFVGASDGAYVPGITVGRLQQ